MKCKSGISPFRCGPEEIPVLSKTIKYGHGFAKDHSPLNSSMEITATATIRDAKVLGTMIQAADNVFEKRNALVKIGGQPGESCRPVEWSVRIFCFAFSLPRRTHTSSRKLACILN